MPEDQRGRRGRRVLYVVNPGSDSDEASEDGLRGTLNDRPGYPPYIHPLPPTVASYPPHKVSQSFSQPTIVTSNFTPSNSHYQGPPLSSPSSTSSPAAEESTPPPSTPAVPNPPVDLTGTNNSTPEMIMSSSSDRGIMDVPQPSTARVGKHIPPAKPAFGSRGPRPVDATAKRPKTVCFFRATTLSESADS